MTSGVTIQPAGGKVGVLLVGLGAVSTTTIAGTLAVRRGLAKPIGSLAEMGTIRLGKRTESRSPAIRDFVPLAAPKNASLLYAVANLVVLFGLLVWMYRRRILLRV